MGLLSGEISQYHFKMNINYVIVYDIIAGVLETEIHSLFSLLFAVFISKKEALIDMYPLDTQKQHKLLHNTPIKYL